MTFNDGQVTVHHSRFDQMNTRTPYAQGAATRVHLFNNVYSTVTDWAVGSGCRAQILLQGCVFENVEAVSLFSSCEDATGRGLLNAVAGSNLYRDGTPTYLEGDGAEPHDSVFVPDYEYDLEPAVDALASVVLRAGAGGRWAQPVTRE